MSDIEITHMTSKGQIVIPLDIRKEVNAAEGTVFAVFGSGNTIVLKKMQKPTKEELRKDWSRLVKEANVKAKKAGIKEEEVVKIVHNRRGVEND